MKQIICFFLGHKWGPSIPWSTFTIEVPFDGDYLVHRCKRCRMQKTIHGSHTRPGMQYVASNQISADRIRDILAGEDT